MGIIIISVLRMDPWASISLIHMPDLTQLITCRTRIQTQVCQNQACVITWVVEVWFLPRIHSKFLKVITYLNKTSTSCYFSTGVTGKVGLFYI